MGSWAELDAVYPPGALTPAAALVALVGTLEGAASVYVAGRPAPWLPGGLGYDPDLLARAERALVELPREQLLADARVLLTPRQRLGAALCLLDRALATATPEAVTRAEALLAGLGCDPDELAPHRRTLALLHDRAVFPQ